MTTSSIFLSNQHNKVTLDYGIGHTLLLIFVQNKKHRILPEFSDPIQCFPPFCSLPTIIAYGMCVLVPLSFPHSRLTPKSFPSITHIRTNDTIYVKIILSLAISQMPQHHHFQ